MSKKKLDYMPREVVIDAAHSLIEGNGRYLSNRPLEKLAQTLDDEQYHLLVEAVAQVLQIGRHIGKTLGRERAIASIKNRENIKAFKSLTVEELLNFGKLPKNV